MFDRIHVDETGLTQICDILADRHGSVVVVPIYVKVSLMGYLVFACAIPVPYAVAGEGLHMWEPSPNCCVSLELTSFAGHLSMTRYTPLCSDLMPSAWYREDI